MTYSQKVKSYVWFKDEKHFLDFIRSTFEQRF